MARLRRQITYANVVSTVALIVALGMGGAYAVNHVGSRDIKDNSVRSVDLRDGKAVRGADVAPNSLGRRHINEKSLVATQIAPVRRSTEVSCELGKEESTPCVEASVRLNRRGRILAIATGGQVTDAEGTEGSEAQCRFWRNGAPASESMFIGEATDSTSSLQGNGFAFTFLSPGLPLDPGEHQIALVCWENDGEITLEGVSLVAVALTGR
jgi:hypothetical protein